MRHVLQKLPPRHVEGRRGQPLLLNEYGGVGLESGGPLGKNPRRFAPGYGRALAATGVEALHKIAALTQEVYAATTLGGFCYTQLYDIEYEKNGLLRYDRSYKPHMTLRRLHQIFNGSLQVGRWSGVAMPPEYAGPRRSRILGQLT